jgi:hypothetical protein
MAARRCVPGSTYGLLFVLWWAPAPTYRGGQFMVCRCVCGNIVIARAHTLERGSVKSCGCVPAAELRRPLAAQPGDVFERLTVVEEGPRALDGDRTVFCRCSCGKAPRHRVRVSSLVRGATRSCGCLAAEALKALHKRLCGRPRRRAA